MHRSQAPATYWGITNIGRGIFIKRKCIYSNICIEVQYQRHIGINPMSGGFHGEQGSSIDKPHIYVYKYIRMRLKITHVPWGSYGHRSTHPMCIYINIYPISGRFPTDGWDQGALPILLRFLFPFPTLPVFDKGRGFKIFQNNFIKGEERFKGRREGRVVLTCFY